MCSFASRYSGFEAFGNRCGIFAAYGVPSGFLANRSILGSMNVTAKNGEPGRSEEHTSELQSRGHLVCRLLLEKKKTAGRCSVLSRVRLQPAQVRGVRWRGRAWC